jgi:hypothetical protein
VIIKSAPSTPNAGSSVVSSTIGAGVEDAVAAVLVVVGVIVTEYVTVALRTTGMVVVMGMFLPPDRLTAVVATELVVRTDVTSREIDGDGDVAFLED